VCRNAGEVLLPWTEARNLPSSIHLFCPTVKRGRGKERISWMHEATRTTCNQSVVVWWVVHNLHGWAWGAGYGVQGSGLKVTGRKGARAQGVGVRGWGVRGQPTRCLSFKLPPPPLISSGALQTPTLKPSEVLGFGSKLVLGPQGWGIGERAGQRLWLRLGSVWEGGRPGRRMRRNAACHEETLGRPIPEPTRS
jgi:hypothetical protein